jgi:hypothetical protein
MSLAVPSYRDGGTHKMGAKNRCLNCFFWVFLVKRRVNIVGKGHAKGDGMAASITRIIRKALPEIIQSKDATTGERLEACKLLWKIRVSATKGKPRGRAFPKKTTSKEKDPQHWLENLLSNAQ